MKNIFKSSFVVTVCLFIFISQNTLAEKPKEKIEDTDKDKLIAQFKKEFERERKKYISSSIAVRKVKITSILSAEKGKVKCFEAVHIAPFGLGPNRRGDPGPCRSIEPNFKYSPSRCNHQRSYLCQRVL